MSKQQFVNNFESDFVAAVLANPITGTPATELGYGILQLQLPAGAVLGTLAAGEYMKLTLFKRASGVQSDFEIVKVLGINEAGYSSGTETRIRVERAQEGTTAKAYAIGDFISCRWTAASAENALYMDGDLAGLASVSAARANLGLGTAAVANTGTGAGNVILGNDSRLTDSRTPTGAAGGVLSGTFPNPGFASPMATTADLVAGLASREPSVTAGTTAQYWRGDKTWRDFFTDVRAAILTGLSTATATAVTAADTVLAAIGKLQAQVSARLPLTGGTLTGDLILPSLNGGALGGDRNKVHNGNFNVNQRDLSGTVTLGANAPGHDRWKASASGCIYTFSGTGVDTTLTIAGGSLVQVLEGADIAGGVHVASWSGTSQARFAGGAPANSGVTATLTAAANTTIEFGVGTVTRVQVELGATPTPFARRSRQHEELICQRYLPVTASPFVPGHSYSTSTAYFYTQFKVPARAAPTGFVMSSSLANYYVVDAAFSTTALTGGYLSFGYSSADGVAFAAALPTAVWTQGGIGTGFYLAGNKILWTGAEL